MPCGSSGLNKAIVCPGYPRKGSSPPATIEWPLHPIAATPTLLVLRKHAHVILQREKKERNEAHQRNRIPAHPKDGTIAQRGHLERSEQHKKGREAQNGGGDLEVPIERRERRSFQKSTKATNRQIADRICYPAMPWRNWML